MTGDASRSIEQRGRDSAFPTTQATWIGARLEEGALGRDALNTHVMSRYAAPLRAYVLGSSIRRIDEADALVHGFFASRLSREGYLAAWRESGLPLRRWLVNGLLLHARERERELRRAARDAAGGAVDASTGSACVGCACASSASCSGAGEIGLEPAAFEAFERAWSRALLADACTLAEQELIAESDADAWESFRRHHLDGLEYAEIAQQLRITPAEARTRARRAAYRYERALVQLLRDEGVGEDELDAEIAWLLEVSTR